MAEKDAEAEGDARARPRRRCTENPAGSSSSPGATRPADALPPPRTPTGRVLVVHANTKSYGVGASGPKASNREFAFAAADYAAMRDSGAPYSGDPRQNKLLPLPRPTYTEFINRARRARMADRLDFVFCHPDAAHLPRGVDYSRYDRVVYAGVSFRRFARHWTPERQHLFKPAFQARALAVLCAAKRDPARLGALPFEVLCEVVALAASKSDARRDDYDDLATVRSGARHLFLPAPGSSGIREALFDSVFGLS